jgi:hypothetical protein
MAKAQNTFIKSKMNKDLDDRILSKGEYRDAQNINVSKSEGSDVGALENVLGNLELNKFTTVDGAVIIGNLMDYTNDRIYVFITNYTDSSSNSLRNPAGAGAYCSISVYDLNTSQSLDLVVGSFLNFSTTHFINGVNIVEDLLFFTDNRNQPRKINVNLAINSVTTNSTNYHYTSEDQISLAKYSPFKAPELFSNYTLYGVSASLGTATIPSGSSFIYGTTDYPVGSTVYTLSGSATSLTAITQQNIYPGMYILFSNGEALTSIVSVDINPETGIYTVVVDKPSLGVVTTGTAVTTKWWFWRGQTAIVGAFQNLLMQGMYIVLSGNNSQGIPQSQNMRVLSTLTTGGAASLDTSTFVVDTTVPDDKTWASQNITVYYQNSYTRTERHLSPTMLGVVTSGNGFEVDDFPKGGQSSNNIFQMKCNGTPKPGMLVSSAVGGGNSIGVNRGPLLPNTFITNVTTVGSVHTITVVPKFNSSTFIKSTQIVLSPPNPYYLPQWPGDSDFLSKKFVRFAYRFKFEDGEYSVISPFTQPAFIPNQDGYLTTLSDKVNNVFIGVDEEDPYYDTWRRKQERRYDFGKLNSQESDISTSTVLNFFENRVEEVDIIVPLEYAVNDLYNKLKVIEIDVLYKESDALIVKVLDTFSSTDSEIVNNSSKKLTYNYQSRKPFRNLKEADTVRVYDKTPVRAKTQSVTGNRVVFGNFFDKPTPPLTLDYSVGVNSKFGLYNQYSNKSSAAYPTHSVKQNRNYQVGIVLQDKYGRSSDVVLSSLGDATQIFPAVPSGTPIEDIPQENIFSGSTVFHDYRVENSNIYNWFGDSIKILFNNSIPETVSYADGYPGIYRSGFIEAVAENDGTNKFLLTRWNDDIIVGSIVQGIDSSAVSFSEAITAIDASSKKITLSDNVTISTNTAINIIGNSNPLGWYSYKVVVKQEAEDYYNAYVPNPLSGTTQYSRLLGTRQSYLTLTGDNIDKIPADTIDPAPEQTQFRTSDVVLYPRVAAIGFHIQSEQFSRKNITTGSNPVFFTVDAIGKTSDMGLDTSGNKDDNLIKASGIYDAASNPSVAKISTYGNKFGAWYNNYIFSGTYYYFKNENGDKDELAGSLNFNTAVRMPSMVQGEQVKYETNAADGSLFPLPDSKWAVAEGETSTFKDLKPNNNGTHQWGVWSHYAAASNPTSLHTSQVFTVPRGVSTGQETFPNGSTYNYFTPRYRDPLVGTASLITATVTSSLTEVILNQDNTAAPGEPAFNTFSCTGSGVGLTIKITVSLTDVSTNASQTVPILNPGIRDFYFNSSGVLINRSKPANFEITVVNEGAGYAVNDIITIDPAYVNILTGSSLGGGFIFIKLRDFNFNTGGGIGTTVVNGGGGSGLTLRAMCSGPWQKSGQFVKQQEDIGDPSGRLEDVTWQVVNIGSGYRAGNIIEVPAFAGGIGSPTYGLTWTDPIRFTLLPEHLKEVNQDNPDPIGVLEIEPKISNLDIYWETSTSGLISELNSKINNADSAAKPSILTFGIPGSETAVDLNFPENRTNASTPLTGEIGSLVSQFTAKAQDGTVLSNCQFSNLQVTDGSNNPQSGFALSNSLVNSVNNGKVDITTPRFFQASSLANGLSLSVEARNIVSGIAYTNTFTWTGSVSNNAPLIVDNSGSAFSASDSEQINISLTSGGGATQTSGTQIPYAFNGAAHPVSGQQIKWSFGINQSYWSFVDGNSGAVGNYVFVPDGSPSFVKQASRQIIRFSPGNLPSGTYNNTLIVEDASGIGGLSSQTLYIEVVVSRPEGPPPTS